MEKEFTLDEISKARAFCKYWGIGVKDTSQSLEVGDTVKIVADTLGYYGKIGVISKKYNEYGYRPTIYVVKIEGKEHKFIRELLEKQEEVMAQQFKIGDRVQEAVYGKGTVVKELDGMYFIKFDKEHPDLAIIEDDISNRYAWRKSHELQPIDEKQEEVNAQKLLLDVGTRIKHLDYGWGKILKKTPLFVGCGAPYLVVFDNEHEDLSYEEQEVKFPYKKLAWINSTKIVEVATPQGRCFTDCRDLEKEYEQQEKELAEAVEKAKEEVVGPVAERAAAAMIGTKFKVGDYVRILKKNAFYGYIGIIKKVDDVQKCLYDVSFQIYQKSHDFFWDDDMEKVEEYPKSFEEAHNNTEQWRANVNSFKVETENKEAEKEISENANCSETMQQKQPTEKFHVGHFVRSTFDKPTIYNFNGVIVDIYGNEVSVMTADREIKVLNIKNIAFLDPINDKNIIKNLAQRLNGYFKDYVNQVKRRRWLERQNALSHIVPQPLRPETLKSETVHPLQEVNNGCDAQPKEVSDFVQDVCCIFDDLKEMFIKKNKQYATTDPLANFRTGAFMHTGRADYAAMYEEAKGYQRKHIAHIQNNKIDGPQVAESLKDNAIYSIIELEMLRRYLAEKRENDIIIRANGFELKGTPSVQW